MPTLEMPARPSISSEATIDRFDVASGASGERLAVEIARPAVDEGAAPSSTCVLYLHGFASSRAGEKSTLLSRAFLERGVAFCSFDFRGHGESSGTLFDLTLTRTIEDAASVARHLRQVEGFERLVLFGSSMGGGTALWFASQQASSQPVSSQEGAETSPSPEIAALVLLAPALRLEQALCERFGADGMAAWEREGRVSIENPLPGSVDPTCELSWALIDDLRRYDLARLEAAYRAPTLIFQGIHDASVDWREVAAFVERSAGASLDDAKPVELHLWADAEHRMLDRLDRLWRRTEQFLDERGLLPARTVRGA